MRVFRSGFIEIWRNLPALVAVLLGLGAINADGGGARPFAVAAVAAAALALRARKIGVYISPKEVVVTNLIRSHRLSRSGGRLAVDELTSLASLVLVDGDNEIVMWATMLPFYQSRRKALAEELGHALIA